MSVAEHRLALPAGYQLGKYRLREVLGAGGFGITYLADDSSLGRRVAIKELLPNEIATRLDGTTVVAKTSGEESNLAWARDRFLKEGIALAACDHPNVVNVFEMIEANGTAYMVTKYEDGRSFAAWLKEVDGSPTEKELRAVLLPLLSGLEKVHRAGFLHRDLKPENIYLTDDGRPILLDFGSARQAISDRTTSLTSIVTSGYAPFEQYHEDGNQGPWTDIYALAAVMYRSIHGTKPPEATRRLKDDPCLPLARNYQSRYSARFLSAIDKGLEMDPQKRPQTVADWRKLLGDAPVEQAVIALPWHVLWRDRALAFVKTKPEWAAGAAVAVLALAVAVVKLPSPKPLVVQNTTPTPAPTPAPATPAPSTPPPILVVATPAPATPVPLRPPATPPPIVHTDPPKPTVVLGPRAGERWKNSLGQEFAPVPGQPVHMAITETRRGDFERFVRDTDYNALAGTLSFSKTGWKATGATWVSPGFPQTPEHPVVGVSAYDAETFAQWLTARDRAAGLLGPELAYRLPSAEEWSAAAGPSQFPWGEQWPPQIGAGNFASDEAKTLLSGQIIAGYRDHFAGTAPAGSFQPNAAGFYDLAGNAAEWVATWYQPDEAGPRALQLRGGSWLTAQSARLQRDAADPGAPELRTVATGFRLVLAPAANQATVQLPPRPARPAFAADEDGIDARVIGVWEGKGNGSSTLRWEQEPDGRYSVSTGSGPALDTGTLRTGGGRLEQHSEASGRSSVYAYQPSKTQLVMDGALGKITWRKVSSTTTAMRRGGTPALADNDDDGRSRGPQSNRPKSSDYEPRRDSIGHRAKEIGSMIKRHLPF